MTKCVGHYSNHICDLQQFGNLNHNTMQYKLPTICLHALLTIIITAPQSCIQPHKNYEHTKNARIHYIDIYPIQLLGNLATII